METTWTLEAVPQAQKATVSAAILIECRKANRKGSAFLLKSGTVVTNYHVVTGCEANELFARSSMGPVVTFKKMVVDEQRDLAILQPNERMVGGLELGPNTEPAPETRVKTWGYPLSYEGPAPILSVGYVAGYAARGTVKHIVINGAFNPGNSGGALLSDRDNRVVGIVVTKWKLFSPLIEVAINGFNHPGVATSGTFSQTLPDGTQRSVSDQEIIADVLNEFYEKTQVMIGEAISVSELKALLNEKEAVLKEN